MFLKDYDANASFATTDVSGTTARESGDGSCFELAFQGRRETTTDYRYAYIGTLSTNAQMCVDTGTTTVTVTSTGGTQWGADVTAVAVDGNIFQVPRTNAYVDIKSKYSYVPDDVFEAISQKISEYNAGGNSLSFVTALNSYVWHQVPDGNTDGTFEFGCMISDMPEIKIEWDGKWFTFLAEDLIIFDQDSVSATDYCRFTLGKGGDSWVLGQNFFQGYSSKFCLDKQTITVGINDCYDDMPLFKEAPYTLDSNVYPQLIEVGVPSSTMWEGWVIAGAALVVGLTISCLMYHVISKRAEKPAHTRLSSSNVDMRNISVKDLEKLTREDREVLKNLLTANIRSENNARY